MSENIWDENVMFYKLNLTLVYFSMYMKNSVHINLNRHIVTMCNSWPESEIAYSVFVVLIVYCKTEI